MAFHVDSCQTVEGLVALTDALQGSFFDSSPQPLANILNALARAYPRLEITHDGHAFFQQGLAMALERADSVRAGLCLMAHAQLWSSLGENDSAVQQLSLAQRLFSDKSAQPWKALAHMRAGHARFGQGLYDLAADAYLFAKTHYLQLGDSLQMAWSVNNLGSCYYQQGYYGLASSYYLEAVGLFEAVSVMEPLALTLYNLGRLFELQKDYSSARAYFERSRASYLLLDLKLDVADLDLCLAEIDLRQKQPQAAQVRLEGIKSLFEEEGGGYRMSQWFHAAGQAWEGLGDYEQAVRHYRASLALKETFQDPIGEGQVYNSLAVSFYLDQQWSLARENYEIAYKIGEEWGNLPLRRNASLGLAEVYEAEGNGTEGFVWYKVYKRMEDSIFSLEKIRLIAELDARYESTLKDRKIDTLESTVSVANLALQRNEALLSRQRARQGVAWMGIVLLVILLLGILWFFRQRRAREIQAHNAKVDDLISAQESRALEAIVEGQEVERKRLARELHDHFGSMLATVLVNLNSLPEGLDPSLPRITELVNQACEDVRNLSHNLHVGMADQWGLVSAVDALVALLQQSRQIQVHATCNLNPETISMTQEIHIYRIIQELVSNVLKHSQATKVEIQVTGFDEMVNVIVEDNGKGFDPKALSAKRDAGIGLSNLQERMAVLEGEFHIDSRLGKGTSISLDFPIMPETEINP